MKSLVLLELNEINLDYVKRYIASGERLPGFVWLLEQSGVATTSEDKYDLIEPWIQWVSVHTGKRYEDHGVFRLGDVVDLEIPQIFEVVESLGYRVAAVSPMNASNKLNDPVFFIPDAWTSTGASGGWLIRQISEAIRKSVNNNAGSVISLRSFTALLLGWLLCINFKKKLGLLLFALRSLNKTWRRALWLDWYLFELHESLRKSRAVEFSTLFLNAGAHLQHHYLFNSRVTPVGTKRNPSWYVDEKDDPVLEAFHLYDSILQELSVDSNTEVVVATGLSQKPCAEVKFYYRLKNHEAFLELVGIQFVDVFPRMSRDFLVTFEDDQSAKDAGQTLSGLIVDGRARLFGQIEVRDQALFITLDYSKEITINSTFTYKQRNIPLSEHVNFVAIKNGEHSDEGFAFFTKGLASSNVSAEDHVSSVYDVIVDYFET